MRTPRRTTSGDRTLSPIQFERMLQRAERFQKLYGPNLLPKPRPSPKRPAA
jgi:hypothetical protein